MFSTQYITFLKPLRPLLSTYKYQGFCLRVLSHVQFWNKQWVWNLQMVSAAPLRTCCIWHWGIIQGKSLFTWSSVVQLMVNRLWQMSTKEIYSSVPVFCSLLPHEFVRQMYCFWLAVAVSWEPLIGWNRSSWHFWTIDNILTLGPITRSVTVLSKSENILRLFE